VIQDPGSEVRAKFSEPLSHLSCCARIDRIEELRATRRCVSLKFIFIWLRFSEPAFGVEDSIGLDESRKSAEEVGLEHGFTPGAIGLTSWSSATDLAYYFKVT
jgi:hypothetical protein